MARQEPLSHPDRPRRPEAVPLPRSLVLVALAALVLAGCVSPAADLTTSSEAALRGAFVPQAPDFDFTKVVDADHANHLLPQLHAKGHGLELSGFTPIQKILPPGARGSITQVDVWQSYAVVSGMEGGLAFAIVDITDPAKPKAVSYLPSAADGWTARFSEDGQYVFYGCQMLPPPQNDVLTNVRGTCTDPNAARMPTASNPGGVIAVDVSDKAKPKIVDFLPGMGAHNLFVATIGGVDTIFTDKTNIIQFDRATGKLREVATVPGQHDATAHRHPLTGDWLLFTGTEQLAIYNVNDPSDPQPVYLPTKGAKSDWVGWHEQTLIPGLVDGRVILAVGGETRLSTTQGVADRIAFLDVTDPAKPVKLSEWSPPFQSKVPWLGYLYSAHEMAATPTGQVAIAWYHGGVWVVDVSTKERQAEPVTLAAYLPHETMNTVPSMFFQTPIPAVPYVWGVGWDPRGYLVVPDMHTGLYLLEPAWGLRPTGLVGGGQ